MDMTLERFDALAQAWGGDIARWPEAERAAAAMLAARAPQAAAALAQAAALDAALADLDATPGPAPSQALLAVCAEAAMREAGRKAAARRLIARAPTARTAPGRASAGRAAAARRARWPMAAAMAAAAVAGVVIGASGMMEALLPPPQDADAVSVAQDLLAPPDDLATLFEEAT